MKKITQSELELIQEKHKLWRDGKEGGERADLSHCDCSGLDFSGANMTDANMAYANMAYTNLTRANLTHVILTRANMTNAILADANMAHTNLTRANMAYANMLKANLTRASMTRANMTGANMIYVDMTRADMTGVNMTGVNMTGANLTDVKLWGTIGNGKEIRSTQLGIYNITYTADVLQIGCEQYPIEDWWTFDDDHIYRMDGEQAVDFWREYKETIYSLIKNHPATPTGCNNEHS